MRCWDKRTISNFWMSANFFHTVSSCFLIQFWKRFLSHIHTVSCPRIFGISLYFQVEMQIFLIPYSNTAKMSSEKAKKHKPNLQVQFGERIILLASLLEYFNWTSYAWSFHLAVDEGKKLFSSSPNFYIWSFYPPSVSGRHIFWEASGHTHWDIQSRCCAELQRHEVERNRC